MLYVTYVIQQCGILTCVDLYEPMQPPFKLRKTQNDVRSELNSHRKYKQLAKALISLCVAQAGLNLCWSHIPHCWKSHVTAHFSIVYRLINPYFN